MGFVLQFAAFLSICCLIRDVVTHPNQDKDKRVNNKHVRHSGPGIGDFYFDELKGNDDYLKTGRVVPQSAWSKEDKEQTQPVENKAGAQFSDDFSFKSALSYFLNMLEELKKNVFSIKEMTSLTDSKGLANSQGDFEDMVKQNKMEENSNKPKTDASAKNTEFENENQRPKSNYITEYYQNNDIKFVEDDLETSGGDESDDSSHKTDEGTDLDDDTCIYECSKISGEPVRPSYDIEETTAFLSSQTKVPEENGKASQNTKSDEKGDDFKESTTKPSKMKPNNPKISGKETENMTTAIPSSKTGICLKKNNDGSSKANEKNEPSKKHLKSIEYPTSSPQNKKDNKAKSEESNQNKTPDNLAIMNLRSSNSKSSGKNSINKDDSNLDGNSGVSEQSTTLSPQSSKDVIHPENMENKPYTSGISPEKQQEQIISMKPENQKQAKKNPKPTVSLKSFRAESETPNLEKNTDTKTKENPTEGSNNDSSPRMGTYNEHEQNSKTEGQQTSNSFDTENTFSPATSGNNMNAESLKNHRMNNLNGKKDIDENKKPNPKQGKKDSESQENKETAPTETQQSNNDSQTKKSSKNNKLTDSINENENPENLNASKTGKKDSESRGNKETAPTEAQLSNNDSESDKSSKNYKLTDSTNENENPEKSSASKQGKKDSESQGNKETAPTETQQSNNDSESDKSSKNNKLTDSASGNENSEKSNPTKKGENNPETQINKEALPTETQQSSNNSEPDKSFVNNMLTDATKGDENSEKNTKKGEKYSETQRNTEAVPTEKQQLNNDSGMINFLKNKRLNDSNRENNEKVVDNIASMLTNESPSPRESNLKIQNQGVEGLHKQQESKSANKGNLNENDEMLETPPDEEYEYDDNENSDTFDKFMEMMTSGDFNQNQESKLITNISNEETNDEMNPDNTSTLLTNELQISQQVGNAMEEKPEEQYDTLLEYFYKHSNNPMILHLKNQSKKFSLQKEV